MFSHVQKQLQEVFHKKIVIKVLRNSQQNTCSRVSFSIELIKSTLAPGTDLECKNGDEQFLENQHYLYYSYYYYCFDYYCCYYQYS